MSRLEAGGKTKGMGGISYIPWFVCGFPHVLGRLAGWDESTHEKLLLCCASRKKVV